MSGIPSKKILSQPFTEAPVPPGLLSSIRWKRIWQALVDLVFPPRCAGCGRVDTDWCSSCQQQLDSIPLLPAIDHVPGLDGVASTAPHTGIARQAVHGLKYENALVLAGPLAQRLERQFHQTNWTIDMVVPVPLHPVRQHERGYNQAQYLAEGLALRLSLPCSPSTLSRERDTRSQLGLDAAQRRANVSGAFRCHSEYVSGRHVLLVDDVFTTGATLAACAEALFEAGAKAVYAITVTVAQ